MNVDVAAYEVIANFNANATNMHDRPSYANPVPTYMHARWTTEPDVQKHTSECSIAWDGWEKEQTPYYGGPLTWMYAQWTAYMCLRQWVNTCIKDATEIHANTAPYHPQTTSQPAIEEAKQAMRNFPAMMIQAFVSNLKITTGLVAEHKVLPQMQTLRIDDPETLLAWLDTAVQKVFPDISQNRRASTTVSDSSNILVYLANNQSPDTAEKFVQACNWLHDELDIPEYLTAAKHWKSTDMLVSTAQQLIDSNCMRPTMLEPYKPPLFALPDIVQDVDAQFEAQKKYLHFSNHSESHAVLLRQYIDVRVQLYHQLRTRETKDTLLVFLQSMDNFWFKQSVFHDVSMAEWDEISDITANGIYSVTNKKAEHAMRKIEKKMNACDKNAPIFTSKHDHVKNWWRIHKVFLAS